MDQGTEPIRQDIDQIRASMTDKMEKIEARIKGTVDETTGSVKRMVDVKYQVTEHPWTALGISVLAGIALGTIGSDASPTSQSRTDYRGDDGSSEAAYERARAMSAYSPTYSGASYGQNSSPTYGQGSYGQTSFGQNYGQSNYGQNYGQSGYTTPGSNASSYGSYSQAYNQFGSPQGYDSARYNQGSAGSFTPASNTPSYGAASNGSNNGYGQPAKPTVMDQLTRQFGGEIEMLKSAAVSSLMGVIRDTIRQNFPSVHQEMERMRPSTTQSAASWPSTTPSPNYGNAGTSDYAHSAVNSPSHVTGMSDPASGSSSHPDDLQRSSSTL